MSLITITFPSESVERVIASEPGPIFDVLADPSRHREIDGSGTVRDASAGTTRLALGDRFGMGMRAGLSYEMVNTVVELEKDRRIAWQPRPTLGPLRALFGGRIWRYELEPVDGGTLVRETWDLSQEKNAIFVAGARRMTRSSMARTLERLEAVVTTP